VLSFQYDARLCEGSRPYNLPFLTIAKLAWYG
jgi:hypothetical protein